MYALKTQNLMKKLTDPSPKGYLINFILTPLSPGDSLPVSPQPTRYFQYTEVPAAVLDFKAYMYFFSPLMTNSTYGLASLGLRPRARPPASLGALPPGPPQSLLVFSVLHVFFQ